MDRSKSLALELLESSFDEIAPRGEELVEVFYRRLFEAAPEVEPLFAGADMLNQRTKLLATLVLLRKSLRDLKGVAPRLRTLGALHVAYGARPEHYPVVAGVMLDSMAEVAGPAWTPEVEAAWSTALNCVAGVMLDGAAEAERLAA
jgi:hemoglobin-like flavoprotein